MAPRELQGQHSKKIIHRRASLLGMDEQQQELVRRYPRPSQEPFPVRLPAHPENPELDQALYQMPGYRYPHTLSFMGEFTPEDEAYIIEEFEKRKNDPGWAPAAPDRFRARRSQSPSPEQEAQENGNEDDDMVEEEGDQSQDTGDHSGWLSWAKDLLAMRLQWIFARWGYKLVKDHHLPATAKQLQLPAVVDRNILRESNAVSNAHVILGRLDEGESEDGTQTELSLATRNEQSHVEGNEQENDQQTKVPHPPGSNIQRNKQRHSVKQYQRNGGGPKSFVTGLALQDNRDASDSETVATSDSSLVKEHLSKNPSPQTSVGTVFGPGAFVTISGATPHDVFPGTETVDDGLFNPDVVFPGSRPEFEGITRDVDRVRNIFEYPSTTRPGEYSTAIPGATPPGSPLPSSLINARRRDAIPTSASSRPGYRTREPNDTIFRRGSAGVDPRGAFARSLPARPTPQVNHSYSHSDPGIEPRQSKDEEFDMMQDSDDEAAKVKPRLKGQTDHGRYSIKPQVVSGSFGSFEDVKPSRFDERKYRRLQTVREEAPEHGEEEEEIAELHKDKV
ncbi:hypothetical protein BCR34DRAFT_595553 [Clohesyomyces aquaticus]|uniref:Uncharacterized protein n=1 Tax=Clohesyomyces aquaticus TaxID=1231657 RepID=A0A1Y2AAT1_9PLEO|nr:hypothetical protein BCR34DRAFT_595553 [Clohesyomyces aquaticus]